MPAVQFFAPITKVDYEKREVWGTLAEEAPDKVREIFDYEGSKPYFKTWNANFEKLTQNLDQPSLGNTREMHTKSAAGKFITMEYDDDNKRINVASKVVDDQAWKKVVEGVYTGFSIGGDYVKRWDDPTAPGHKRYIASPTEGSLVDNPCMYGATFSMIKSDGSTELRKFVGEQQPEPTVLSSGDTFSIVQSPDGVYTLTPVSKAAKTKRVDGVDLHSKAFLIVGDSNDPSTWHLPVHFPSDEQTKNHIHAAMGRVGQVEGVSAEQKAKAARAIAALARKHGIEIKDFNQKFLESQYPRALKKSLYHVSTLAECMQTLAYLERGLGYEQVEGDESQIPGDIHEALKSLQAIFMALAEEESSELLRELEASKAANPNLTKGGGTEMDATQIEQLKKGVEGATTPEQLKKFSGLLAKAVSHMAKLAEHVGKLREAHDAMGEHVDAMCDHMGKAAGPMHEHVTKINDGYSAVGDHLDKAEGCIEDFESEASSEVNETNNQKAVVTSITKRLERGFERRFAAQQRGFEKVLSQFAGALEKVANNGGVVSQPSNPVQTPARTFVAPEKSADVAGTGGVIVTKAAPGAGQVPAAEISPVDASGMPNPAYIAKVEQSGHSAGEFLAAAKLAKLQSGDPFPKEFGNATIY